MSQTVTLECLLTVVPPTTQHGSFVAPVPAVTATPMLKRLYGGVLMSQGLVAACRTVDAPPTGPTLAQSLHASFVGQGDATLPVHYDVMRDLEDVRLVTAYQLVHRGRARPGDATPQVLMHMMVRFTRSEEDSSAGWDSTHDVNVDVTSPRPESLPCEVEVMRSLQDQLIQRQLSSTLTPDERQGLEQLTLWLNSPLRPTEMVPVINATHTWPGVRALSPRCAYKRLWMRVRGRMSTSDTNLHRCALAYLSDQQLLDTALLPHGVKQVATHATLTHSIWFTLDRRLRADEWLSYDMVSPQASGALGLAHGQIRARDGSLVAYTAQQGLIRPLSLSLSSLSSLSSRL
jgi:acyl-CoA thioesterase-2